MKAVDLLRLACSEGACLDGLVWLYVWIEKHPNGTASEFFRQKARQRKFSNERFPYHEKINKIIEICSDIKPKNTIFSMMRFNYVDNKNTNISFINWSLMHLLDWSEFTVYEKHATLFIMNMSKECGLYLADMFEEDGD